MRVQLPVVGQLPAYRETHGAVGDGGLHTVCEEARCPNLRECWAAGDATFMVAGKSCTRGCRFCSVKTLRRPPPPEEDEPERLADAVARMRLAHVVVTVVNRDDLPDGGAAHYRRCIDAVHARCPNTTIELLGSDLDGNETALAALLDGIPLSVLAHNVECVPRLDATVRDRRATFGQSARMLKAAKRLRPDLLTKSSLMVGMGERDDEVVESMRALRMANVDLITLGQYLAPGGPGERFLAVERYVAPEQFNAWAEAARAMGFKAVAAGPLVRSSYRAGQLLTEARLRR